MGDIITFEKQPERVWRYTYWIIVNGQYSGYISKCKYKGAYPFAYSCEYNIDLDYGIDHKYKTFNELKKAVKQIIKEKINEGNGIQKLKR
jgi:hypothetical protein